MDIYNWWFALGTTNSKQAALIVNGKDPRHYERKIKFPINNNDFSKVRPNTWQWATLEAYFIFEAAGQSDWVKYIEELSDPHRYSLFNWRPPKEASPSAFISLAKDKQIELPPELEEWAKLNLAVIPDKNEADECADKPESDATNALPPRALTGIAIMFPLDKDEQQNIQKWKMYAAAASRNELIVARISTIGGRGKSIFDPWLVGDWLVYKSHLSRAEVNRRLAANFEPGYDYIKDSLLP